MITKIKTYLNEHKTVLQFIKFSLISMIAGLSEIVSFLILSSVLPKVGINSTIDWFVFVYPAEVGGLGALIAFLVSATIGQIISFIINFKKTFKSTNNMAVSAIGYAIMAILIIIGLNTYIGGLLNTALGSVIPNQGFASFIAKSICQFSSFLIVFPMNKFVIMREKKTPQEALNETVLSDDGADVFFQNGDNTADEIPEVFEK